MDSVTPIYFSIFATAISLFSLYYSYKVYTIRRTSLGLDLKDREPRFEFRCEKQSFENNSLVFKTLFRTVQGIPAEVKRAYIHYWFYCYEGGQEDEVWNEEYVLGENFVSKPEDEPLKEISRLNLTHMITPTSLRIFGVVEYDDESGKKWRVRKKIEDMSIKQYLDEIRTGDPVYSSVHS